MMSAAIGFGYRGLTYGASAAAPRFGETAEERKKREEKEDDARSQERCREKARQYREQKALEGGKTIEQHAIDERDTDAARRGRRTF